MSPAGFWQSTPREFFNRLFGFNRHEIQVAELQQLNTRMIMFWMTINSPYIEKKDKPKSFEEFNNEMEGKQKNEVKMSEKNVANMANFKDK